MQVTLYATRGTNDPERVDGLDIELPCLPQRGNRVLINYGFEYEVQDVIFAVDTATKETKVNVYVTD